MNLRVLEPGAFEGLKSGVHGLAFGLARTIFSSVAKQRDRQLRALADGLVDACRPTTRPPHER